MSRWIEIDTALLKTVSVGGLSAKALWKRIMQQPSIDIVRCKDCKWYEQPSHKIYENCVRWKKTNGILIPIMPDDFCSYGERREP